MTELDGHCLTRTLAKQYETSEVAYRLYTEAQLGRAADIFWGQPARSLWDEIIEVHRDDLGRVVRALAARVPSLGEDLEKCACAPGGCPEPPPLRPLALDASYLRCDREEHWSVVEAALAVRATPDASRPSVVVLGGPEGAGHEYFVNRLRADRALLGALVCEVNEFEPRPVEARTAVFECANAFARVDETRELVRREITKGVSFVIVFPLLRLDRGADLDWADCCYRDAVPPLLADLAVDPGPRRGRVAIIQPLSYRRRPWSRLFGRDRSPAHFAERLAELGGERYEVLPAPPLHPLGVEHVARALQGRVKDSLAVARRIIDASRSDAEVFAALEMELADTRSAE